MIVLIVGPSWNIRHNRSASQRDETPVWDLVGDVRVWRRYRVDCLARLATRRALMSSQTETS